VVAKRDRVGEILEAEAVLGEAANGEDAGDRADRKHEALVRDRVVACFGLDGHLAGALVQPDGVAEHEVGVRAHLP
jgi:hypothetical protein